MLPRPRSRSALAATAALLAAGGLPAQVSPPEAPDSTVVDHRVVTATLALTGAYAAGGFLVMERVWYSDQERVPFHFFNDNSAYLQVDKFGHAFGSYVQSHVGYHVMRRAGVSRSKALVYGGMVGLVLQTPIEIMDGLHEGWGFSWGDMAANAAGSALVVGQELVFGEQLVRYKFSYRESAYARMANGYLGTTTLERLLEDYNGHTYWLSAPLARLSGVEAFPPWLSIAFGYGANGMFGEFENITEHNGASIPETARYRQFLVSLDVDWARVPARSPIVQTLLVGLTFAKLPFPALEVASDGRVRGYWLFY
jgi:uncharacterized protein YfiM (DUF2279 family)